MRRVLHVLAVLMFLVGCDSASLSTNSSETETGTSTNTDTDTESISETGTNSGNAAGIDSNLNVLSSRDDVSRFLSIAGMGGNDSDLDSWVGSDAADWLKAEFQKVNRVTSPAAVTDSLASPISAPSYPVYVKHNLLRDFLTTDSPLRTRMTFALSQIMVVGGDEGNSKLVPIVSMRYRDVLDKHAFGNYRELLEDATYEPAMARWLTYIDNTRGDPVIGREPDENYARELLQLFTIGLHVLNADGSQKTDSEGNPIPTYQNEDIAQLARVFTGFTYDSGTSFTLPRVVRQLDKPLIINPQQHDPRAVNFMNTSIPANTSGPEALDIALDGIFAHPNIGPFIGRQLIQRFTSSHPSPDYIERVTAAFNSGRFESANGSVFGRGVRGDLEATIAAVLLDKVVFTADENTLPKVREPLLKLAQWFHAFDVEHLEYLTMDRAMRDTGETDSLGMAYLGSPSVFNFYRPGYVAPRTRTSESGFTVPELQIATSGTIIGYLDLMAALSLEQPNTKDCTAQSSGVFSGLDPCNAVDPDAPRFKPDYSNAIAKAGNVNDLVAYLNTLLVGGRLRQDLVDEIVATVGEIPVDGNSVEENQRKRVQVAVLMIVTSPTYSVTR